MKYVYHPDTGNLLQVLKLTDRAAGTTSPTNTITTIRSLSTTSPPSRIRSACPVARNEYDDAGRLTAIVDADGKRTEFVHSTTNLLRVVIDRLGTPTRSFTTCAGT